MNFLGLKAFMTLISFEFYVVRNDFAALYKKVRNYSIHGTAIDQAKIIERICLAMDLACLWYPKQILCLQRSAATTCMLRKHGVPAKLVIAAKQMPFQAHAWVEVDGRVVNDKSYVPEIYAVLDKC